MAMVHPTLALLALSLNSVSIGYAQIISDLVTPLADQSRALEIKSEQFWQPVLQAAEKAKSVEHSMLYADVEAVVATLPTSNEYVRQALNDALSRLRHADAIVGAQGAESSEIASERLSAPVAWESKFSFLTGGQNYFSLAVKRFIGGGEYSERVQDHVHRRQSDILPALRGAAASSGNVLADCRVASGRSFDVLKYDIYNNGVPKTPEPAKAVAYRLVEAIGETRHRFMQFVKESAEGIARDTESKHDDPSATVTRSLLVGVEDQLQRFGSASQLINL